jgi:hypothetical protein
VNETEEVKIARSNKADAIRYFGTKYQEFKHKPNAARLGLLIYGAMAYRDACHQLEEAYRNVGKYK